MLTNVNTNFATSLNLSTLAIPAPVVVQYMYNSCTIVVQYLYNCKRTNIVQLLYIYCTTTGVGPLNGWFSTGYVLTPVFV